MTIDKNIPYYILAGLLFVALKLLHMFADNDALVFLIKPTNSLIEVITNSDSVYSSEAGFFHEKLNIVVDRSCSGFNFWMLCCIMLLFTGIKFMKTRATKLGLFPIALLISYCVTILVNTSRIMVSLVLKNSPLNTYEWMHRAEGSFIYLSFLIVLYLLMIRLLKNMKHIDEKFA